MTQKNECKWCRPSVVEGIVDIDAIDDSRTVTEEIYERRLEICMDCPSLQYGTTCRHSGCIVSYRTLLKDKSCPFPGQPKWL
ncbi:DUF6171 family protein [Anaerobacillus alkaliphilus]|uniref:DUF6171 family protein n=1 Tax=Anaerobacillus alkaliphilus TaxID=1548597 RepID=UPI00100B6D89|nr:DUF6171 family protein [Anaerobacillus alkaliphilus]